MGALRGGEPFSVLRKSYVQSLGTTDISEDVIRSVPLACQMYEKNELGVFDCQEFSLSL